MWLVNWLIARATLVLAWFGGGFYDFYAWLVSRWYWLGNYANQAFSWSRNWAWPLILSYYYRGVSMAQSMLGGVSGWVEGRITWVYNQIAYWVSVLRQQIWSVQIQISNWVSQQVAWLINQIAYWVSVLRLEIWSLEIQIRSWVSDFINNHPTIRDLVSFFSPENRARLLDLIQTGYQTLSSFYSQPVASILTIIKPIFLELLSYSVAYAMGTVDAVLPDWPDLSIGSWSGELPGDGSAGSPPPAGDRDGMTTRYGNAPSWLTGLVQADFPASQWVNALEISYLESGWRADAVNDTRHLGGGQCNVSYNHPAGITALTEYSVGLYQINICAHGGDAAFWSVPANNVAKAAALWRASGWRPWSYSAGQLGV